MAVTPSPTNVALCPQFTVALRPRKPYGRGAQDGHLDLLTVPELLSSPVPSTVCFVRQSAIRSIIAVDYQMSWTMAVEESRSASLSAWSVAMSPARPWGLGARGGWGAGIRAAVGGGWSVIVHHVVLVFFFFSSEE